MLICTFSPAASAPLVPVTVSEVALVLKSFVEVPVSGAIAEIASASVGATVSRTKTIGVRLVPVLL